MVKDDNDIRREWWRIDDSKIEEAVRLLSERGAGACEYLAHSVAAICNVDVKDMLSDNSKTSILMARWLFWYAYRYATNDTLAHIAAMTESLCGHKFRPNTIGGCINKMGALIDTDDTWQRRWFSVKRIIKLRDTKEDEQQVSTIVIQVPKGLKEKITFKIQEK